MMVIINRRNLSAANEVFAKYNTKPVYSILEYDGKKYLIFEKGIAAAMIEVDMKFGCQYKEGRIIEHDQI